MEDGGVGGCPCSPLPLQNPLFFNLQLLKLQIIEVFASDLELLVFLLEPLEEQLFLVPRARLQQLLRLEMFRFHLTQFALLPVDPLLFLKEKIKDVSSEDTQLIETIVKFSGKRICEKRNG